MTLLKNIFACFVFFTLTTMAFASMPQTISYQGYLTITGGAPASGPVSMTFSLYSSNLSRNNPVWRETQPAVAVTNGIYSTQLGSVTPITAPFDVPYYLGVKVAGDTEMSLQALSSTPYALRAGVADNTTSISGQTLVSLDSRYVDPTKPIPTAQQIATLRWDQVRSGASTIPVGANPHALAFDGSSIWVTNYSGNSVQKINPATGTAGSPISVGANPYALAFDGSSIWVANMASNTIMKINTTTDTVMLTIDVGNTPHALAFDGSNIWVANYGGNNVQKIDPANGSILGTYTVLNNPFALAFDGSSMWVSNWGNNSIQKINTATGQAGGAIIVGAGPTGLAFDGSSIWVANNGSNSIRKINPITGTPATPITVGSAPSGLVFDGSSIWVSNWYGDSVMKVNPNTGVVGTPISVGPVPAGLAFDGSSIWVANYSGNSVTRLSAASEPVGVQTVGTGQLTDGTVTTSKIADGAVTDIKITGPVSDAKLTGNVVLLNSAQTFTGLKAFNPTSGTVPYAVDATKNGMIANLNAEMVGSKSITDITAMIPSVYEPVMIRIAGSGGGTVGSAPSGIFCSGNCVGEFTRGGSVVLTATADATSTFTGWDGAGCSGTGTCTVTADTARTVEATFSRAAYSLTVNRTGTGTILSSTGAINCGPNCSSSYNAGTVVTLSAAGDQTSTFAGWSGGSCSGTGTCVVTVDGVKIVSATFTTNTFSLTATRAGTGSGSVDSNPAGINCGGTCSANYNSGTIVNLTATPTASSSFSGWSGACSGTGSCLTSMSSAKSVTATFSTNSYQVTVTKIGSGGGTVTSSPAGISCGSTCSASYSAGQSLTLTAVADTNSTFDGWTGACVGTGNCNVTVDAAKSVMANFTRKTYAVTVSRTGSGTVTSSSGGIYCGISCVGTLQAGDTVTLTATPDSGATFAGWSGACSGTSTCTLPIDAAKTVNARFTAPLTTSKAGTGSGVITSTPAGINCGSTCASSFDGGTTVNLTATPDSTSAFTGWTGACSGIGTCIVTVDGAQTVTANFERVTYLISTVLSGNGGGTVTSSPAGISCGASCSASYDANTAISLTATPDATSTFTGWSGACSGTGACLVTANSVKTVTATFTRISYSLSVSKSGAGLITTSAGYIYCGANCTTSLAAGTSVTLTATPDSGASFSGWSGACSAAGTSPTCVITVNSNTNVSANFLNPLTVSNSGTGSGTIISTPAGINCGATCTATYSNGATIALAVTPAANSIFAGWIGACSGSGACSVSMDGTKSVSALFMRQLHTLAISISATGSAAGTVTSAPSGINCPGSCLVPFDQGTNITLFAIAGDGSTFSGWSGACSGAGGCTVSMDGWKSVTATFSLP